MHTQHDSHSSTTSGHVLDIHPESTAHDFELTNHHDGHHDDHSATAVDVSPDKLLKNTSLLNPLVVILLFLAFFLCIPGQRRVPKQKLYKILFPPCYYLFQPPLRAPPVK